ncbi:MAG: alcohol dehydrogenase catalytic domain-containing protein [Planctomycetes bacterium]|nr:alcohol dehydrogenase catalytic domain-containing protein [Planctomycetota bacterium]
MRGLIFRNGSLSISNDLPEPIPEGNEVVVRVNLAGICATDLEISKGYLGFEGVLGHEFVGVVDSPDDPIWHRSRVVGEINCACGSCPVCLDGHPRHCPRRTVLGISGRPGAFADKIKLPRNNLIKVPDSVSDEDAVYAEPLAAVLRIVEQKRLNPEDEIIVIGDGRLGLLMVGVGRSLGWRVSLLGKHPDRAQSILGLEHAMTPGEGKPASYDVAVDCTGASSGIAEAFRLLKPLGRLILKTTVADWKEVDLNPAVINEISILGSRCGPLTEAVQFLRGDGFRPSVLTSAHFPLSRGLEAFEKAGDP